MIHFYSTHNKSLKVSFNEAVQQGLAPDGGLYMPEAISKLPESFWIDFPHTSFSEMALEIASHFLGITQNGTIRKVVSHALQFDAPLVRVEENIYALELFHGPTLAFKDFGARFLAGVLGSQSRESVIIVATSGDTGSAVANGFLNVPGTKVVVLYPSGKVSEIQEQQFTTLGGNITALEIDGTFDDCQKLVKQAFNDQELQEKLTLTSANSINIARLLPQTFYYFRAYQQLMLSKNSNPVAIAVPSGNFGNLTAGLMAKRMGLPVHQFIAATNENDVVPEYLASGKFKPRPSRATISNAMDVGSPSNFERMLDLYEGNHQILTRDISGFRISEDETRKAMKEVFENGYLMDPHAAVAYCGLKKYLFGNPGVTGIFLATAHPGKFKETVEKAIGKAIDLPERLLKFSSGRKVSVRMRNDFNDFKKFLLK